MQSKLITCEDVHACYLNESWLVRFVFAKFGYRYIHYQLHITDKIVLQITTCQIPELTVAAY